MAIGSDQFINGLTFVINILGVTGDGIVGVGYALLRVNLKLGEQAGLHAIEVLNPARSAQRISIYSEITWAVEDHARHLEFLLQLHGIHRRPLVLRAVVEA